MKTTFAKMSLQQLNEWYLQQCEKNGIRAVKRGSGDIEIMRARCMDTYNLLLNREKDDKIMARKAKGAETAGTETTEAQAAATASATDNPAPAAAEAKVKGRKSKFSGTNLWYVHETNKRQAGSWGHKSMEVIRDKPGISYEDFVKAGGRTVDLAWDVERDNVVFSEEAVGPMREKFAAKAPAAAPAEQAPAEQAAA